MTDGPAVKASLNEPNGLTFANGKIYITDTNNHLIRVYDISSATLSTLEFKGIGMLTQAKAFRGEEKELPAMNIAPGTDKLSLEITLPKGTDFTKDAPFSIEPKSDNANIISFKDVNIAKPAGKLEIPITASTGMTTVTIDLSIYYCSGNQGQCFFKDARLKIPVNVTDKGNQVLAASYKIEH